MASIINGRNSNLIINRNIPPINPKTKANIAINTENTNAKGVNANTINTNKSFKPNITSKKAIKISMTDP